MTFANAVQMAREVVEGLGYDTATVLPAGFVGSMPIVHVTKVNGVEDFLERTDQIAVDVYAAPPGPDDTEALALAIAEQISDAFGTGPLYLASGTVDEASVDQVPVLRPYVDTVDVVSMSVSIAHRPID